jgi:hypothetical protein
MMSDMAEKEYLKHENQDRDAWICICKYTPTSGGFYPCNEKGFEIEPRIGNGWTYLFVCDACGRIINQDNFEVVGITKSNISYVS